jgi:hypothetical protein
MERRQAHSSSVSRVRGATIRVSDTRAVPLQPGRPLGAPPWRFSAGDPRCRLRQWGTGADQRPACARPYGPAGGIPDLPRRGSLRRRRTPLPAPPAGSSPETPLTSEDANLCSITSLRSQSRSCSVARLSTHRSRFQPKLGGWLANGVYPHSEAKRTECGRTVSGGSCPSDLECVNPDQPDNPMTDHCPSIMVAQRLSVASGTSGKPW